MLGYLLLRLLLICLLVLVNTIPMSGAPTRC